MRYVIYADSYEGGGRLFDDIRDLENVDYILPKNFMNVKSKILDRAFSSFLCRCGLGKGNQLKKIIYPKCNIGKSSKGEELCFIYLEGYIKKIATNGFTQYLKTVFPNSHHVIYYQDIHAAKIHYKPSYKTIFDKICIFDKTEADRMGIEYYPLPYSVTKYKNTYNDIPNADLYFVGKAKSRYKKLLSIYEFCKERGITTNFYILDVPTDQRKYEDDIHYVENVPYEKTIEIAKHSNCGIELRVDGADSFSPRVMEALVYGKKIISDNMHIKEYKYYNENWVEVFGNIDELDGNFIQTPLHNGSTNEEIIKELSPKAFLDYLDDALS